MWQGPTSPKPLSQKGRSPMKVTQTSTNSTDTLPRRIPGASGHTAALRSSDNDPAIPRIPGPRQPSALGPRPAPPARPLTVRPLAHDLDWDHIPSAPGGSFYGIEQGTYTRTGTGYGTLAADRAFGENAN